MLRLEDRIYTAMGNGMGINLDATDVINLGGLIVALVAIRASSDATANRSRNLATEALARLTAKDGSYDPC